MRALAGAMLWLLMLAAAGLPLAWVAVSLVNHPSAWGLLVPDAGRATVFARTLGLAAASATLATTIALIPASALARRGRWILIAVMAGLIAAPAAAWAYGWAEVVAATLGTPRPGSWADLLRVVVTNATMFWPVPAAVLALARRNLPANVLEAADLDGARRPVTLALLIGPAMAGWAGAMLLSGQNLPSADQTGVVVASVVVRDAYTTTLAPQDEKVARAVAVGLPSMLALAGVALAGWAAFAWSRVEDDDADRVASAPSDPTLSREQSERPTPASEVEVATAPVPRRSLRSRLNVGSRGLVRGALTALVLLACTVPPLVALARAAGAFSLAQAWQAHAESFHNAGQIALIAAAASAVAWALATLTRARGPLLLSLAAFLLGGQFVALGTIRAYNALPRGQSQLYDDLLGDLYDTPRYHAAANVALLAWIALAAGRATWGRGRWRDLRDLAAADGAGTLATAFYVVWPLAWPGGLAATLAVFALTSTETHAAALMTPGTPANFMLSNLHTIRLAAMAEAALLSIIVAATLAVISVATVGAALRLRRHAALLLILPLLTLASCDRGPPPPEPLAVWDADDSLAYPRGVAYSPFDGSVWTVDKNARVTQFGPGGTVLGGFNMPEKTNGKPVGLSVDDAGNVWVPDTHHFRVIVFRPDGGEWFRFGSHGTDKGQFVWPTDVLVRGDLVYVSEYGSGGEDALSHDRIQVFRRLPDGTIRDAASAWVGQIGSFGTGPGEFRRPQSMVLLGTTLWVTDATNHRLLAFDADTFEYERQIGGEPGDAPGAFRFPYGLDADAAGNLIVTEFGNSRVQKIDPATGAAVAVWDGGFGSRPGQLKYPWAAVHDARNDRVVVIDSGNDRLQVIGL